MSLARLATAVVVAATITGGVTSAPRAAGPAAHQLGAGRSHPAAAPRLSLASTTPPTLFGLIDHNEDLRHATEQQLGIHSALVGYFAGWKAGKSFPTLWTVHHDGAVPVLAWMPQTTLADILSGSWDGYITNWLKGAKAWQNTVIVRLMPEMNVGQPYTVGMNGNTAEQFVAAWRHIVGIGRQVGATNVKWMWNPDRAFKGSQPLAPLYPGRYWVDWIGIDGYNFGTADHGGWIWFRDLFAPTVTIIRQFAPYKPMMIAEVGCTDSRYKAAWMSGMFEKAPAMGFRAAMYFDYLLARDWRIASNSDSLAAAKTGVHAAPWKTANPVTFPLAKIEYYVSNPV
jgi:hypothetical protein